MKTGKKYQIIIAVVLGVVVVTAGLYLWRLSTIKKEEPKPSPYDHRLQFEDMVINGATIRIARLEGALSRSPDNLPVDLLKIYSYDAQAGIGIIGWCLAVPDDCTLSKKLDITADVLMKYAFSRGSIVIMAIAQRGDRKIAVVDLRETDDYPNPWRGFYFQGSTGGMATTYILTNTFLQPHYSGAWIDGVEFLYEGAPIQRDEWDHISLHGTIYRK